MSNVSEIIKQHNRNASNEKEKQLIHAIAEIKTSTFQMEIAKYKMLSTNVLYLQRKHLNNVSI